MQVLLKYFTDNGTERRKTVETVEAAILTYRECKKKKRAGANCGQYSIDNGVNWIRI